MLLYKGPHININYHKKHKRFLLYWKKSPTSEKQFKAEILKCVSLLKANSFHQILWHQSNFKFKMDEDCKQWFDKIINYKGTNNSWLTRDSLGYHHLYFVVGVDIKTHIGFMEILKKGTNPNKSRNFATEEEALKHLNGESDALRKNQLPTEINYKGTDENGQSIFELKEDSSHIESSIKIFKHVLEAKEFIQTNKNKFSTLTFRENQILALIVNGYSNQEISQKLFVSVNTIRTHRNRTWKKLEISSLHEAIKYNAFF